MNGESALEKSHARQVPFVLKAKKRRVCHGERTRKCMARYNLYRRVNRELGGRARRAQCNNFMQRLVLSLDIWKIRANRRF